MWAWYGFHSKVKELAQFDDIRPYNEDEIPEVMKRLARNDLLVSGIRNIKWPSCPGILEGPANLFVKRLLAGRLGKIKTIDEFQGDIIAGQFLNWVFKNSMKSLTVSGIEGLSEKEAYIFISNHRDIVLDSAFLNYILYSNGFKIAYTAFGDNLLINNSVADLLRMNRGVMVKRGLPPREQLKALKHLSEYISSIREEGRNFWIAQREGRAKDGIDMTNPAIIKMLYLARRKEQKNFSDFIKSYNIVPVAISYEKDPCDRLKGWEIHRRQKTGEYRKRKNMDLISMSAGISGDKGLVHLAFGKPLEGNYADEKEVAEAIDCSIFRNYRLWPTNYIAHDVLFNSGKYNNEYSVKDKEAFLSKYENLPEEVRKAIFTAYANPVLSFESLEH